MADLHAALERLTDAGEDRRRAREAEKRATRRRQEAGDAYAAQLAEVRAEAVAACHAGYSLRSVAAAVGRDRREVRKWYRAAHGTDVPTALSSKPTDWPTQISAGAAVDRMSDAQVITAYGDALEGPAYPAICAQLEAIERECPGWLDTLPHVHVARLILYRMRAWPAFFGLDDDTAAV